MDQIQFDQITQFLRLQKQIMESYDSYLSAAARRIGLTKPEADILLFLANNPQFHTARDVVALRGFSKTYVSKAVDLLGRAAACWKRRPARQTAGCRSCA